MRDLGMRTAVLAACVLVLGLAAAGSAAGEDAREVDTSIQKISLFKNGLAHFTVEGRLPEGAEGRLRFGPFLAPSHGTFWMNYPKGVDLQGLAAREVTVTEQKRAANLQELLKANVGRRVGIYCSLNEDATIEGKLVSVTRSPAEPEPARYRAGGAIEEDGHRYRRRRGNQMLLVRTSSSTTALDPAHVERVDILGEKPNHTFGKERKGAELTAHLGEPAPDRAVSINYLAKGLTWAPSYRVDLTGGDKARLSAKALIINDATDLDDVDVELVTGFPHLRFSDILSPVGMKEDLASFLQSLRQGESEQGQDRSGLVQQQALRHRGSGESPAMPDYGAADKGRAEEDLFLYPVDDVSLDRGERGYYPLFSASVPCEHIYRWSLPSRMDDRGRRRDEEEGKKPEVWHSLKLQNTTDVPWTTAPGETVSDGQILGQDMLRYTPKGGEQILRITRAAGVKTDRAEFETGRERNARQFRGYHYDLVTVEGHLKVTNYKDKTITLEVTKTLSGEVKSTSPEADVETPSTGLRDVNPTNELTWTFDLEAGGSKELTYTCDVYVRD